MVEQFGDAFGFLLLCAFFWTGGAITQRINYQQLQRGRVIESESRFVQRRAKRVWVLLCGLPTSANEIRLDVAIAQVLSLVCIVMVLIIGLCCPTASLGAVSLLLFLLLGFLITLWWVFAPLVEKKQRRN